MNCETFAAQPLRSEYGRLVVYENGRIVLALRNIGDAIGNIGDINLDGIDDLPFLSYFGPHMGQFSGNASVVTLAGGKIRIFLDLTEAYLDTCGMNDPSSQVWAHRVTVQKGVRPLFSDTTYLAGCQNSIAFRVGVLRRVWSDVK